jgi:O-acetyl-ADP-ribose deacetylase
MPETRIVIVQGDITTQHVDAIVNAANSTLLGGGGVDGAIHRRGGPGILAECRALRVERLPDGLPAGRAVATTAGELPARRVIHVVGPVWHGGDRGEDELLASAYRSALEVARDEGLRTIAFPSVSTGAYRFPLARAAPIALSTVTGFVGAHPAAFDEVRFVLFDDAALEAFRAANADADAGGA